MNIIKSFINKYEIVRYGISGVVTAVLNLGTYELLNIFGIDYKISNIFALLISKVVAFFISKYFVYKSNEKGRKAFKEFVGFALSRVATALLDYFGLILLVECVGLDKFYSKIIVIVVVIISNYVLGKLVFKKGSEEIKKV